MAQIRPGDMGMRLSTRAGFAGSLCRGFTCQVFRATATTNELVSLEFRGPRNALFWLLAAPQANLCVGLPGLKNRLIVAPPILVLGGGALSQQDTIRACPGGKRVLSFRIPVVGRGTRFAFQALIMANWRAGPLPTFSPAIVVTVG